MHRHDCDLWLPPAPSSYRNVYREGPNFLPRSPREQRSESMDMGKRGEVRDGGFRSVSAEILLLVNDGRAGKM